MSNAASCAYATFLAARPFTYMCCCCSSFRKRSKRLLVLTDATEDSSANLGANVVINYDTPQLLYQVYSDRADTYMCRVSGGCLSYV